MTAAVQARQIQKVYSEWCVKAAEIILAARIDSPGATGSTLQTSASFNLKVPELFNVRTEAVARPEFFQLRTQRSFQVEIYLGSAGEDAGSEEASGELLERWTFTFLPTHADPGAQMDRCNQTLVRKLSVALRSLMCFVRLLPAHGLCRNSRSTQGSQAAQPAQPRSHRFRVEAWPPTSRPTAQELLSQDFVSLQSSVGTLRLSLSQRKDLKSLTGTGPVKSAGTVVAQVDTKIEMEEGFFADTSVSASSSEAMVALRRLDKIAEEPEVRAGYDSTPTLSEGRRRQAENCGDGQSMSTAPTSIPVEARSEMPRPRMDSEGSVCSTLSASSRAASSFNDHAVVLGSTPPLAGLTGITPPAGLVGMGSASSSRSHTPLVTPHTTPKMGPVAEPAAVLSAAAAPVSIQAEPRPGPIASWQSPGMSHATALDSASMPPGVLDDLSGIWMNSLPEWGRKRSMSLGGASRGTGSRSLSPEDPCRGAGSNLESSAGPALRGSRSSSGGTAHHRPLEESGGEICMFGMSDEEEEKLGSDDDYMERNVVASAIMEGGGGGAFAASGRLDAARLGLAGLDMEGGDVHWSRKASETSQGMPMSPPILPKKMLSPLIAQLNPFQHPPSLDLPPAVSEDGPGGAEDLPPSPAPASTAEQPRNGEAELAVHLLLEEMGDLVCRLQQRQELAIVRQEASPEDLLRRLEHFRGISETMDQPEHDT